MFEIKYRDVAGRIGILKIRNKRIETPFLFPVINPKKEIFDIEIIKKYNVRAIMTNSYILYKDKEIREEILKKGIKKFLNFDGIIETDSGSYQILHYKKDIEVKNKEIVEFQIKIDSDIINVIDIPTDIDKSHEEAEKELNITLERIKEGIKIRDEMNKDILINGAIQGGIYLDLRRKSAEEVSKLNVDIYAIGTIVPYMIKYKFKELFETIIEPRIILPLNKPVHLFGLGHTLVIPLAVSLGCDIFDSASYILYAYDNRVITPFGTFKLNEMNYGYIETKNKIYEVKEVKEMERDERIKVIAENNLYNLLKEIEIVKDAIKNQYLMDIVLIKAHMHYNLYKATKYVLEKYYEWLKKLDPIRKKSGIFYGGELNEIRTDIRKALERLDERVDKRDIEDIYGYIYPFNSLKDELWEICKKRNKKFKEIQER